MVQMLLGQGCNFNAVVMARENEPMDALRAAGMWGKQDVYDYLVSKGCLPPED